VETANAATVTQRIDLNCGIVGFTPPPVHAHLKFMSVRGHWTMLALVAPGRPAALAEWVETFRPTAMRIAPGLAPRVLRADFDPLPAPWQRLVTAVRVHHVELTTDGMASLFVEGPVPRIERFVAGLREGKRAVASRRTLVGPERVHISARQLEAISMAVTLGYYEIPHRLDLRALAKRMGISHASVAELLRRGEGLIINNYIDSLSAAEINERGEEAH
jgi:hypothetical protein